MAYQKSPAVDRSGSSGSLADVIDRILDKGLVIDAWIRVSLVGLEIITVEARVVVASVDTYLRFADAISKIPLASAPPKQVEERQPELEEQPEQRQLPSPQDIKHYLDEQGEEGLSLDQLADHFHASREAVADGLRRLEAEGSVSQRERHS
ncbi:MAG: gas vesicle structural protein GvpA [Kofleriaceae bacterium]|nr:gas vesicle structural protein GvpA [Kofleriaceae bacterium]